MLKSFCKHGLFDLTGELKGDLEVDQHHLIEDTGIAAESAVDGGKTFCKVERPVQDADDL